MRQTKASRWVIMLAAVLLLVSAGGGAVSAADVVFKDSPAQDHWAGPAVGDLSIGKILIGYPDGTFRGDRAATRYELAMALDRLYALVRQLLAMETVGPAELEVLAGDLQAVREDMAGVKSRLDRTEQQVEAGQEAVQAIKAALVQELADLRQEVVGLTDRITAEEALSKAAASVADAVAELERKYAAVGSLDATVTQQRTDLLSLRKAVDELAGAVTELQGRPVAAATPDLGARLAGDEDMIGRQAALLTQQQADLEALRQAGKDLAAAVAGLDRRYADHEATPSPVEGQLAELERKFAELSDKVERLGSPAAPSEPVAVATPATVEAAVPVEAPAGAGLPSRVAALEQKIDDLVRSLQAEPAEVAGMEQLPDGLTLEEEATRLDEHSQALAQHDAVLLAQQADLAELRKADATLAAGVEELQRRIETLAEEARAQAKVGQLLSEQSDRLGQYETGLGVLRKSLTQTMSQVAQVAAELSEHVKADALLSSRLTELGNNLEGLAAQLREVKQSDDALGSRVTVVEGRSDELGKSLEKLSGRTQENQQGLSDLRLRVQALEEETAKLKEGQRRMAWVFAMAAAALAVF